MPTCPVFAGQVTYSVTTGIGHKHTVFANRILCSLQDQRFRQSTKYITPLNACHVCMHVHEVMVECMFSVYRPQKTSIIKEYEIMLGDFFLNLASILP